MSRRRSKRRMFLKYAIIAFLVLFLISSAFFGLEIWDRHQGKFSQLDMIEETVEFEGKKYLLNENLDTFLVLGLDKFVGSTESESYNNDKQADFIMLFVFDNENQKFTALQVNRDTMANVDVLGVAGNKISTESMQIALAHTYGNGKDVSCRNTADSVSDLLYGIDVKHYISLTMDSVAELNDLAGGVEVEVLHDFTGIDDTLKKGEKVVLRSEHALTYIRTRKGLEDSTNATRMKRQQQYVTALHAKLKDCIENDKDFIVNTSLEMAEYIVSDRSVTQLQDLMEKFNSYEFTGILNIEGEAKVGEEFLEFYPDENALKKLVIDTFYLPQE